MENCGFPKRLRILKSTEYKQAYEKGRRKTGRFIQVIYKPNELAFSRFGIAVSKKHGGAVRRNRWKRRIREGLRLNRALLLGQWDLVVVPKLRAEIPNSQEMEQEFKQLLGTVNQSKEVGTRQESHSR
jgi:ribonuclease P protein component